MGYTASRWIRLAYWNLWPATRLLLVMAALAVWLHRGRGINPPSSYVQAEVAGSLAILFFLCALFSVAGLFLRILCLPLYAVIVLNSLFYDGTRQMLRQLVGIRLPCVELVWGLVGEFGLFVSMANSIVSMITTYGHF